MGGIESAALAQPPRVRVRVVVGARACPLVRVCARVFLLASRVRVRARCPPLPFSFSFQMTK